VVLDDERTLFEQTIHSLARLQVRCQRSFMLWRKRTGMEQGGVKDSRPGSTPELTEERTSLASSSPTWTGQGPHEDSQARAAGASSTGQRVQSLQYRLRKEKAT